MVRSRLLAVITCLGLSSMAASQSQVYSVWVHPIEGIDPGLPGGGAGYDAYVDDPSLKFKTLQAAIDGMEQFLASAWDASTNPDPHAIVYAMPGLYGPHGATVSSNEPLPIIMRDRVHVQGVGARRCVIRGASTTSTPAPNYSSLFWPNAPTNGTSVPAEVLVTYDSSTPDYAVPTQTQPPPWYPGIAIEAANVAEVLDGFTFEGGDVQVAFNTAPASIFVDPKFSPAGRVSNCVFDLRDGWVPEPSLQPVAGPYFGVMIARRNTISNVTGVVGYVSGRILIAHNTFVFARWIDHPTHDGWESQSRSSTVGIIDVTNPQVYPGSPNIDPITQLRGLGHACITGNVFRTRPLTGNPSPRPYAMLGIRHVDSVVSPNGGATLVQTNVFDPALVGSTNGTFYSTPVESILVETVSVGIADIWNCSVYTTSPPPPPACTAAAAPSSPLVAIWNGTSGLDPAFVGEYLATSQAQTLGDYRDWRILPGSPMEDLGIVPQNPRFHVNGSTPTTGFTYGTAVLSALDLFQWDGEHWGNPRIVAGAPDAGFDERHLFLCAGSWSNDSNSHNEPGFLHPGVSTGDRTRYFILPNIAAGVALNVPNRSLRVYQTEQFVTSPPGGGNAWVNPPTSLSSPVNAPALPTDHRTKYIAFTQAQPWSDQSLTGASGTYAPLGILPPVSFRLATQPDDECMGACTHSYFNIQAVVLEQSSSTVLLRSNMEGEYR
jgi:hypothetical protein